jgi:hypothetical protein
MGEFMVRVFVVGLGGAAGSILRYFLAGFVQRTVGAFTFSGPASRKVRSEGAERPPRG